MGMTEWVWRVGGIARNMNDATNNRHARQIAKKLERKVTRQETSDVFTTPKTMASEAALEEGGHFNPNGDFVGWNREDNRMITHNHDGHHLTYGTSGLGKTSQFVLPNLVHDAGRYSFVCIDIDHELVHSTRDFFAEQGYDIVTINPSRQYNIPDSGFTPLIKIRKHLLNNDYAKANKSAKKLAKIYKPELLNPNTDDWLGKGTRSWLRIGILTECDSNNNPSLTNVFDRLSEGAEGALGWIYGNTDIPQVLQDAKRFENELGANADKQAHWQVDGAATALELFQSGTDLSESISRDGVDFGITKERLTIIYLSVDSDDLDEQGAWLSTLLASALGEITAATGSYPVKFVADEFSNMPRIPDFLSTMQLCRKNRLKLDLYAQSPQSLRRRYGRDEADEIEKSCSMVRYLAVDDLEIAKQLSQSSGTKTAFVQGISTSQRRDALSNVSASEQKIEQLTVGEALTLPNDRQLISLKGLGLLRCGRQPWWNVNPWNDGRIKNLRNMENNKLVKAPLKQ